MDWFVDFCREYPSLPIFLTIGLGFWIGHFKYKSLSLGAVTSVLLVGVVVGQMNIPIGAPLKSVFFLIFLFAIGYSVGPQFFRALRGSGLKQVAFACVICVLCFICTWLTALLFGYNIGEAVGLFAGAQTISAVIGVGDDTIATLAASAADKRNWADMIPVCYAVTYLFGTIGSAYLIAYVGPAMLGGIDKVKKETVALAAKMNHSSISDDPAYINAQRPIVFRAYKVAASFFDLPQSVGDIESKMREEGRRVFVERVRVDGNIVDDPAADLKISKGDEIVLSGRREYIIEDESWIGPEVNDAQLLLFNVEQIPVMVAKKDVDELTVDDLRGKKWMNGVMIARIRRSGVDVPVLAQTKILTGDLLTLTGLPREVELAAKNIGYADRPSSKTNMVLLGLGIALGVLVGGLAIKAGGIPISLSTSGGALIAGLVCGWLRSRHPSWGGIPESSIWVLNNLGLNMFIAVVGISAGPTFVEGIKEVGFMLFLAGVIATTLPILIAIPIGAKLFKFPAAINLGCIAGGRTTTASLGAVQDSLDSSIPAMGYTVTYAIGNTLLILMGVAMTLLFV